MSRGKTAVTRSMASVGLLAVLSAPVVACEPHAEREPDGGAARAAVCGATVPGPASPPEAAVTVEAGRPGELVTATDAAPAGTTFWLAPGTHTLGAGEYSAVRPKDGDTFLGAPGAVLDGGGDNRYAFVADAADVTVRGLTVRGFVAPRDEGVVNHDSGDGWVIEHNTISDNTGAAMMAGSRQRVRGNCLRDNGQYAINAYKDGPLRDILVEGNELVGNNTDDWESVVDGCGCTGGMKLWEVDGADIRGNWVHDNRGTGIWADTNNNDVLIEDNTIEDNDGPAITYETSYNAIIRDNLIRRNNLVDGREFAERGDNFPSASIYVSESGGEPRLPARTRELEIYGNRLVDNWSGITLWENADRFCNSPANTSGGCTLLVDGRQRCSADGIAAKPLFDDCRWKTKNVTIHDNTFVLDTAAVGCETLCARMAVVANYGSYPAWSPYHGASVQRAVAFDQHNTWRDNDYRGPWTFVAADIGEVLRRHEWQSPPYGQDGGSTFVRADG